MPRLPSKLSRVIDAVGQAALRLAAITLACVFVAQALLLNPSIRRTVSLVDRLEGTPVEVARRISPEPAPAVPGPVGSFVIRLEGAPNRSCILLVNGEEVADFGRGSVSIDVRAGDLVEIDGGTKRSHLTLRVVETSKGLLAPSAGQVLETDGTIEILCRVRIQ
jgi:hypothetical protein